MRELLEKRHCDLLISAKTVNMFILYAKSVCSTLLKSILILPLLKWGEKPSKNMHSSISDICDRYKRGPFGYLKPALPALSLIRYLAYRNPINICGIEHIISLFVFHFDLYYTSVIFLIKIFRFLHENLCMLTPPHPCFLHP